ncbi:MAG: Na(+)-translocating NADH-quinone reductase subunit C [Fuerstiella sp.]|nr:Na(+)-translocating NADH-quinone reductase subunit C [Fuerstiella sp.]
MQRESTLYTFKVAVVLCLVCSVVVSSLAVGLRGIQKEQKEAFRQQNILTAAGLWNKIDNTKQEAEEFYKQYITPVFIDLERSRSTDRVHEGSGELDPKAAARNSQWHTLVTELDRDVEVRDDAGIRKREKYTTIYEVREDARLKTLVLPIRGYGLWSTLWGFIALDLTQAAQGPESITIKGLSYYEHGETPGLGGEVENPLWTAKWPGKLVYDADWNVRVEVSKTATTGYQVDALSGATITSNGVTGMLKFWLGEYGFGRYLKFISDSAATSDSDSGNPGTDSDPDTTPTQ